MTSTTERHEGPFQFQDGCLRVSIDMRTYRLLAVQKTAYKLADRCTVLLGSASEQLLPITFTFRSAVSETEARQLARLFFEELLDQELREKIGGETEALRALILAHAFSKTDLVQRE